jgi:ubiquinone/menaquinone biosynthesis C-methylase UbiE
MTNTAADAAEQTRAAWEEIADGYDDYVTPTHLAIAERGLRHVGAGPGMRLLDVAAGSGALAITAAR